MFPKQADFRFYRDTYYFVLSLAAVSMVGMIFTLVTMVRVLRMLISSVRIIQIEYGISR